MFTDDDWGDFVFHVIHVHYKINCDDCVSCLLRLSSYIKFVQRPKNNLKTLYKTKTPHLVQNSVNKTSGIFYALL